MTRPRVLIFSLAYFPFVGGAEVAVREIAGRLPGYEFEMLTVNLDGKQKREKKIDNVLVYRLNNKYLFPFSAYRLAVKLHRRKNYDVLWAIMANQAGVAGALFKRRFPAVPFLLTLQEGDDLESLAYRLRLLAPRLFGVFRCADRVQTISNYLARWARKMGAKCPIDVVPNGVDLEKFKVQSEKLKTTEQNFKTVITVSRLVKKNGTDTLIESLKFLPDDIRLQILGVGPDEKLLRQLMSRRCLDSRVEFLGQAAPNEVPNYLAQADIFARPSRSEGLGNSFLEAMAAGLPVIGTPVGGIPDFLAHGVTGWFCEAGNPKSIADRVKYILDPVNRAEVEQIIANAKKLVHEKYDWEIISQKMAQIIANLVKKRSI